MLILQSTLDPSRRKEQSKSKSWSCTGTEETNLRETSSRNHHTKRCPIWKLRGEQENSLSNAFQARHGGRHRSQASRRKLNKAGKPLTQQKTAPLPAHFRIKARSGNARSSHEEERPKDGDRNSDSSERQRKSQSWDLTLPKAAWKNYRLGQNTVQAQGKQTMLNILYAQIDDTEPMVELLSSERTQAQSSSSDNHSFNTEITWKNVAVWRRSQGKTLSWSSKKYCQDAVQHQPSQARTSRAQTQNKEHVRTSTGTLTGTNTRGEKQTKAKTQQTSYFLLK